MTREVFYNPEANLLVDVSSALLQSSTTHIAFRYADDHDNDISMNVGLASRRVFLANFVRIGEL